jgi:hypothetical protein
MSVSNGLNITKLILAILSVFYDFIFIIQHYCLYNKNKSKINVIIYNYISILVKRKIMNLKNKI